MVEGTTDGLLDLMLRSCLTALGTVVGVVVAVDVEAEFLHCFPNSVGEYSRAEAPSNATTTAVLVATPAPTS